MQEADSKATDTYLLPQSLVSGQEPRGGLTSPAGLLYAASASSTP
jgi:hypothetical protein